VSADGISPSKVSVVHLGVDPSSWQKDEILRRNIRAEFNITDQQILVGNVGRMVPMKGQKYLIEAFAEISQRIPVARLMIVSDGELYDELRALARSLDVADRVVFTGFRKDIQALYSAFDIYVHPSIEGGGEAFPFAVLQALAEELPIVATRVADVPQMIEEGISGFLVGEKDASALAERLELLLNNHDLRKEMARKGHERLLHRFTTTRMVDNIEQVYRAVLRERFGSEK
jgi:glycosyltransferase involved in cell wall biosynthesis